MYSDILCYKWMWNVFSQIFFFTASRSSFSWFLNFHYIWPKVAELWLRRFAFWQKSNLTFVEVLGHTNTRMRETGKQGINSLGRKRNQTIGRTELNYWRRKCLPLSVFEPNTSSFIIRVAHHEIIRSETDVTMTYK